jgi:hypothetical protein
MRKKSQVRQTLNKKEQQIGGDAVAPSPAVYPQFRDEYFAAEFLDISVATMRRWRLFDRGPRYKKIGGSVRYAIGDLIEFLSTCPSGGGKSGVH